MLQYGRLQLCCQQHQQIYKNTTIPVNPNVYVVIMSSEIESPLGNFCRTCMIRDNEADTEFQSIFDAIPNTDKRISDLLSILIECNIVKGMPNRMCGKCVQRVRDVHDFQQMCLRTQSKYRQLTEETKFAVEIVVSSESQLDATVEESDPLKEDDCMSEENMEADGKEYATQDLRPVSSLSSDDDFNWPSEEEKCETESKEATSDIQTNKKSFECDICHLKFNKDTSFYYHKRRYHPSSKFVCSTCGKGYKHQKTFIKHKLEHKSEGKEENAEKDETQEEHSEEQQGPSLMQTKEARKRKQIRKPRTCEICHKVFANGSNLNVHKLKHMEERNFLCKECGMAFKCPTSLAHHEVRHAGVKQYECPLCPKKLFDICSLSAHKRTHSEIKPHVCDVCDASFKFAYSLRKHKLYHGEKSVKCEQCDMRFYVVGAMRRHMLIHTGEKPYKCKYCERAYNQSNDLMKHLRAHVGNNVYRCELCPMGFPLHKEMRIHFALHKNDDEATRKENLEALAEYERNLSQRIKSEKQIHV